VTFHQRIFALFLGIVIFVTILEMVRRKKLEEEYSFLWLIIGLGIVVLVLWQGLLEWLTHLIGAMTPTTTIFIFGLVILVLINLHFSVKITKLSRQVKELAQQVSLLKIR
jgi:CDP-diglyceride synthetase